jgi:uncharacterized protein (TIGR00730 family)
MMANLKSVCVFCGSSDGARPEYRAMAERVGQLLARNGITSVYGGASIGLMGAFADAALATGGRVIGVLPEALAEKELAHRRLTELHIVSSLHVRKALMAEQSDGFIALPGGYGTLDELFEVLTWAQIGLHHKPCGLLNHEGFFDQLLAYLDHAMREGMLRPQHRKMLLVETDPEQLLKRMREPLLM